MAWCGVPRLLLLLLLLWCLGCVSGGYRKVKKFRTWQLVLIGFTFWCLITMFFALLYLMAGEGCIKSTDDWGFGAGYIYILWVGIQVVL